MVFAVSPSLEAGSFIQGIFGFRTAVRLCTKRGGSLVFPSPERLMMNDLAQRFAKNPILRPWDLRPFAPYEQDGFFGQVIFTSGQLVDGDRVTIYYGAADSVICGAHLSICSILESLAPVPSLVFNARGEAMSCLGCGLILGIAYRWSGNAALKYGLPVIALLPLLSIRVAGQVVRGLAAAGTTSTAARFTGLTSEA